MVIVFKEEKLKQEKVGVWGWSLLWELAEASPRRHVNKRPEMRELTWLTLGEGAFQCLGVGAGLTGEDGKCEGGGQGMRSSWQGVGR